ncbi:MAG: hypothetical protein FWC39_08250 [Bacteroidetes bacterium]|nr:hypothetical protein [Bacteroidota bacterium]
MKSRFRICLVNFFGGLLPAGWRDCVFGLKRFRAKNRLFPKEHTLIFFTEKGKWHGGFTDRMKGIVSLFHFCVCSHIPFKIQYSYPFELSVFLQPNEYDWTVKKQEISYHRREALYMYLIGTAVAKRLKKIAKIPPKHIHAFANCDIVQQLNADFATQNTWGELFNKLFKPTELLQKEIDKHVKIINGNYICAVFRFQNLLGDFMEYDYKPVSNEEQNLLIEKCTKALVELQEEENCKKILITSDSVQFLTAVAHLEHIFAFPEKVVHIDCVDNEQNSVYMKSFLDFYLLSKGEKIFSIGTQEMYPSEFPLYAAKVAGIPFERIVIV